MESLQETTIALSNRAIADPLRPPLPPKLLLLLLLFFFKKELIQETLNNYKKAQLSLTNPRDAKACQNCSNSTFLQRRR